MVPLRVASSALVAPGSPSVLLFPAEAETLVLSIRRLSHGALVEGTEQAIVLHDVDHLGVADPDSPPQIADHVWSVGHALHATGHHELGIPGPDSLLGEAYGRHPGETDLVDCDRRDCHGETTPHGGLTSRYLPFARLEDVPEQHLVHCPRVDAARARALAIATPEPDGVERSEGAAILPDGSPSGAGDDWVAHWWWMLPAAGVCFCCNPVL